MAPSVRVPPVLLYDGVSFLLNKQLFWQLPCRSPLQYFMVEGMVFDKTLTRRQPLTSQCFAPRRVRASSLQALSYIRQFIFTKKRKIKNLSLQCNSCKLCCGHRASQGRFGLHLTHSLLLFNCWGEDVHCGQAVMM